MGKPGNNAKRHRLHRLGALAAAGLLAMVFAAPAQAVELDIVVSGDVDFDHDASSGGPYDNVYLTGTASAADTGKFVVQNAPIILAGKPVDVKQGYLTMDFGGASGSSQPGFTGVSNLTTGTTGAAFIRLLDHNYLEADIVNVEGATTFANNFTIDNLYTITNPGFTPASGIYTNALVLNSRMIVEGAFTTTAEQVATGNTAINIDASKIGNGQTAVTAGNGGSFNIAAGTVFDVNNQAADTVLTVISGGNAAARLQT